MKVVMILLVTFTLTGCAQGPELEEFHGTSNSIYGEWIARDPMGGDVNVTISHNKFQGPGKLFAMTYEQEGNRVIGTASFEKNSETGKRTKTNEEVKINIIDADTIEIDDFIFHRVK